MRTRHGVGDGSDLGRIQLQQAFIKALMDQVKHVGLLTNPTKLYDLADTATKALTTDSELASVSKLTGLAKSLRALGSGNINMVTLPVQYDPARPQPGGAARATEPRMVWDALRARQADPGVRHQGLGR